MSLKSEMFVQNSAFQRRKKIEHVLRAYDVIKYFLFKTKRKHMGAQHVAFFCFFFQEDFSGESRSRLPGLRCASSRCSGRSTCQEILKFKGKKGLRGRERCLVEIWPTRRCWDASTNEYQLWMSYGMERKVGEMGKEDVRHGERVGRERELKKQLLSSFTYLQTHKYSLIRLFFVERQGTVQMCHVRLEVCSRAHS